MRIKKDIRAALSSGIAVILLGGLGAAAGRQSAEQKNPPGLRTTPLYAWNKDGTPATGLTAADLEVLVGGSAVEGFTLTKSESSNKLVFLVFDTASLGSNLLSKSKKIAESTVSQAGGRVRFVVMTIDPYAGLRPVCGPTADKARVTRTVGKSVTAKRSDYNQSRATDGTGIRDAYPDWRPKDALTALTSRDGDKRDLQEDRQVADVMINSLNTLNEVLHRFPESDKIIHLFSCGIPTAATANHTVVNYPGDGDSRPSKVEMSTPDRATYDQINGAGRSLKRNGALAFFINPGGTRVGDGAASSGEQSLHMLVNESGGRYFEGADKDIIRALAMTEQGYYVLSLPALQEMPKADVEVEVRAKDPEITLASVSSLPRLRRFALMTPQEKQAVILSVLSDGLVGDIDVKISGIPVDIQGAGDEALLTARLPVELSQSEWDIYKVWREPGRGAASIEKEHVLSDGPVLTFGMASRENTIQDAVLVHARSGTVLVCRGKNKAEE